MSKKEVIEAEIVEEENKEEKAYFFVRLVALGIDMLIVSMICMAIMTIIPKNKNYDKYLEEYKEVQVKFNNKEMSEKEYVNKSRDIVYDIDYANTPNLVAQLVIYILYFMVFQYYNKGQTLGKKLMKIKVVSGKDDKLSLNQVAIRSLVINSVLINLIMLIALLLVGRNYYYYVSFTMQIVNIIICAVTIALIFIRKDGKGLHDLLGNTKVVKVK